MGIHRYKNEKKLDFRVCSLCVRVGINVMDDFSFFFSIFFLREKKRVKCHEGGYEFIKT